MKISKKHWSYVIHWKRFTDSRCPGLATKDQSSHPSSTAYLRLGCGGSSFSRGRQTFLSLAISASCGWGILRPRPVQRYNLSIWTWVSLLPARHAWSTSVGRRPGGNFTRCLNCFNWLLRLAELLLYSEFLTDDWTSHLIPKGDTSHFPGETHFSHLYLQSHSFGHDPSFMIIGEGRNEDRLGDRELCLLTLFFSQQFSKVSAD